MEDQFATLEFSADVEYSSGETVEIVKEVTMTLEEAVQDLVACLDEEDPTDVEAEILPNYDDILESLFSDDEDEYDEDDEEDDEEEYDEEEDDEECECDEDEEDEEYEGDEEEDEEEYDEDEEGDDEDEEDEEGEITRMTNPFSDYIDSWLEENELGVEDIDDEVREQIVQDFIEEFSEEDSEE